MRSRALAVAALVLVAVITACSTESGERDAEPEPSGASASIIAFRDLEQLAAASHAVLTATLAGEREEQIPADGNGGVPRTDLVRTFQVLQVLKGDLPATIDVRFTTSHVIDDPHRSGPPETRQFQAPEVQRDREYVLLLRSFLDSNGERTWVYSGQPSVAEVRGGEAYFGISDEYRAMFPPGVTGLEQATLVEIFEASLRAAAANPGAPPQPQDPFTVRGRALDQLTAELPTIASEAELLGRLGALGLDPAALDDVGFCEKVRTVIAEHWEFRPTFDCSASP